MGRSGIAVGESGRYAAQTIYDLYFPWMRASSKAISPSE